MEIAVLFVISLSLSLNLLYTVVTFYYTHKDVVVFDDDRYPAVSILKPVKGIDDEMETNIESFFELDYPDYEILFGVDSRKDPVSALIRRVMERYPGVRARIIETGHRSDINPKVHKLAVMERSAAGALYWITDSNIRVAENTLRSLAEEYILNGTRLVFSPIKGSGSRSFGSLMENSYLSHYMSGNVLGAWTLFRKEVVVGKSMLIEKKAMMSFGGFSYFKDYLAEDQIIGETFRNSGYSISTNATWVTNFNNTSTVSSFYERMSRWAKLRFNMHRSIYFGEILTNATFTGLLSFTVFESTAFVLFPTVLALKVFMELATFYRINGREKGLVKKALLLPFGIILKDLVLLAVWFAPFFSNQVNWRGGRIRIGKRTLLSHTMETLSVEGA